MARMAESIESIRRLDGNTCRLVVHSGDFQAELFITINYDEGRPYEVFINTSHARLNEHMAVLTLLISRMLRGGFDLEVIADELLSVHSAFTSHYAAGTFHASLGARIGATLKDMNRQPGLGI